MSRSILRSVLLLLALLLTLSFALPTTPAVSAPAVTKCDSCLLEAFSPKTLSYEGPVQGDTTITVAVVFATPLTDVDGRTVSFLYSTSIKTTVESLPSDNSSTALFSATWTTLGTTLTFPTTYIAYQNFGVVPKCTGTETTSVLNLPQSTDPAHVIFPSDEDLGAVFENIVGYLDTLHLVGNATDLTQCSFAVSNAQLKKRHGNVPIPIGPRKFPIDGRSAQSNTSSTMTSPITSSASEAVVTTSTGSVSTIIFPPSTMPRTASTGSMLAPTMTIVTLMSFPTILSATITISTGLASSTNLHVTLSNSTAPTTINGTVFFPPAATNTAAIIIAVTEATVVKVTAVLLTDTQTQTPIAVSTPDFHGENAAASSTAGETGAQTTPNIIGFGVIGTAAASLASNARNTASAQSQIIQSNPTSATDTAPPGTNADNANPSTLVSDDNPNVASASPTQVETVGGSQVTIAPAVPNSGGSGNNNDATGVVIGSQTIQPGQSGTVNGVAVSVPSSGGNLIVGGSSTIAIAVGPNSSPAAPPTLTFGGTTITANPAGGFVVASGVTASPGGPAATVRGTTITIASGGSIAVINGATQSLTPSPTPAPVLTLGDQTITASVSGSSTAFVIASGQTLTPGGTLIVSGTTVSLPPGGSAIVVNGQTSILGSSNPTGLPVLTFGEQTITASVISGSSTAFVLAQGQTLTPGGTAVVSGTTFSLPTTGSVVVINGITSTLGPASSSSPPVLTVNGHLIFGQVSNGITSFVLGPGATLTPGTAVVVSGTTFSLPTSGSVVVINGQTSTLGSSNPSIMMPSVLTIEMNTYSAIMSNGKTYYDLGAGTTLTPGGVVTLGDGSKVTLASDGSSLIFGTRVSTINTVPMSASARTTMSSAAKTGDTIASGLGITTSKKAAAPPRLASGVRNLAFSLFMVLNAAIFLVQW